MYKLIISLSLIFRQKSDIVKKIYSEGTNVFVCVSSEPTQVPIAIGSQ